jgi:general secretion pathway protein D
VHWLLSGKNMKFKYSIFKKIIGLLLICSFFLSVMVQAKPFFISELEFKGSQIKDIIRVLAEDASVNIIATPKAGVKEVTVFLKDVTLEQAIKAICQISNLWYRRESSNGLFRLMTAEEYAKDLVVGQDHDIKVFQLHTPNVFAIASAIENLYGDRVEVSFDKESQGGGSNNSGGNNGGSNRSGGGSNKSGNQNSRRRGGNSSGRGSGKSETLPDDLTVEQLRAVASANKQVDAKQLARITGIKKVIYVTVNTEHNLLIVKTNDQAILKSIAKLVEKLNIPQSQVMLEMKVVDVKVGEDFSSLFKIQLNNTGITGDSISPITLGSAAFSGGGSLMYEFISKNIRANVELLEKNNRLKVVSNPMVVASNHRSAKLFVGEERIMVTGYSIDTVDNDNNSRTIVTPETKTEEIGTTLEVTPHINSDGTVHIVLKQENSTLNEGAAFIPIASDGRILRLPIDTLSTAKMDGEVFAKHGYTVAVGGLIRDSFSRSRTKVPFLADLPIIGDVFRSTVDSDNQSEMVLLITPYILNREKQEAQFDPAERFYKHAPGTQVMHSKKMPVKPKKQFVCGEYCSPANLKKTDL